VRTICFGRKLSWIFLRYTILGLSYSTSQSTPSFFLFLCLHKKIRLYLDSQQVYHLVNSAWHPLLVSDFLISSLIPLHAIASNKYVWYLRVRLPMINKNGQDHVMDVTMFSTINSHIVTVCWFPWLLIFVLLPVHGPLGTTTFHLPCHAHGKWSLLLP